MKLQLIFDLIIITGSLIIWFSFAISPEVTADTAYRGYMAIYTVIQYFITL